MYQWVGEAGDMGKRLLWTSKTLTQASPSDQQDLNSPATLLSS